LTCLVTDLGRMRRLLGEDIGGILGFALFADCLLTLDYQDEVVCLASG
jgi:hypothetical protein